MPLRCEAVSIADYLGEHELVDYQHPLIQQTVAQIQADGEASLPERIRRTFVYVRDEIAHSSDIHSTRVTRKASDVIEFREGICYAKSHLLAALLRAQGIPAGFCYQRLTLGATPDTGYSIHGFNAVYIDEIKPHGERAQNMSAEKRWMRLDARGNKPGVQTEFSLAAEYLAYAVRPALGEIDYPTIFAEPHPLVVAALKNNANCLDMCQYGLPQQL